MKKYLLFCFLLVPATTAMAQQVALHSQYMTNYYLLNPAVTGFEKDWALTAGYRNQWVGFEGAPKTVYLSGHTALQSKKHLRRKGVQGFHGAGGYVYSDQTGPTTRSGLLLSYAYHVPLSDKIYASGGVFAGLQQFRFDTHKIYLADNSNGLDPVTRNNNTNFFLPDLSLGGYLHSDKFFAGVSVFQALGNKLLRLENSDPSSRLYRHMFFSGGYNLAVNKYFTLAPSLLVKYVNPAPVQADFNLKGVYNFNNRPKSKHDDMFWAGLSYRTQDALVMLFGFAFLEQYSLSYSYDLTVSHLRHHSAGSHEIVFGMRIK
jgi:type IX secretion system PorP/SprF family membrane protein